MNKHEYYTSVLLQLMVGALKELSMMRCMHLFSLMTVPHEPQPYLAAPMLVIKDEHVTGYNYSMPSDLEN